MRTVAEKEKNVTISEEELEEAVSAQTEPECSEEEIEDGPGESTKEAPEETEETKEAPESGKAGKEKEKKVFGRKNKEDKKTEALNEKIGELEDKVKRQLAEFENFRNRTEKEKAAMFEVGAKSVIEKMLPVVDNFERGLSGLSEEEKEAPFASGMQMIYKQLLTELDNLGVKPIEAVGKEFDPGLHNAVMQVESEEYESGIVAQEMMKGYLYRDSVIRHSMVAVVS
ncbi:MAG: nucleotide exchange factor GrpE [Lachnospiraceae bacterium]|nr:nucleotide exchange factor GrpE [Lachnospiraceae bacterium]